MHTGDGIMTLSHQNVLSYCELSAELLKIEHWILVWKIKMEKLNIFHSTAIHSSYPHLFSSKKWDNDFWQFNFFF